MSAYERVKVGKLVLKGGQAVERNSSGKKKKRKKAAAAEGGELPVEEAEDEEKGAVPGSKEKKQFEIDDGTGFAPDGKKSKKYEELFPVETKRFGYSEPAAVKTREDALEERVKRKADRYCK